MRLGRGRTRQDGEGPDIDMEALAKHRFTRAIAPRTAFAMHPKAANAPFVPPVIVRALGRSSIFINASSHRYADNVDGDVLRYSASVNRTVNDALQGLADACAEVDIVALIDNKYYLARGKISRTELAGFNGYDVHLRAAS